MKGKKNFEKAEKEQVFSPLLVAFAFVGRRPTFNIFIMQLFKQKIL
jgi:hypothetical protein